MKILLVMILSTTLVGCGTFGGAIKGAGEDLKKTGEWIQKI